MALSDFSREERVLFENQLEKFEDTLTLSRLVNVFRKSPKEMVRAQNVIWRPMPYIMKAEDGADQTGNFLKLTQMSVPAQINIEKSTPWSSDVIDTNDPLQEDRAGQASSQVLGSEINQSIMNIAALQGSLVVKRSTAATGFDDVALADSLMSEQGIDVFNRKLCLSPREYNQMASNLAERQTFQGAPETAYERAKIPGEVSGFQTYKFQYANRLLLADDAGTTVDGAGQFHVPQGTIPSPNGGPSNVDNRYQTLSVLSVGSTLKVGDALTIAGVEAVHHITKESTGELKTFRITQIISGGGASGDIQISPAIISAEGASRAEEQYQNVTATPANGAAVTFLNTADAFVNPFWKQEAMEILPGRYNIPSNAGAQILRGSTAQGFELTMMKQFDIQTRELLYRFDTFYGVAMLNPEMCGMMIFSQP